MGSVMGIIPAQGDSGMLTDEHLALVAEALKKPYLSIDRYAVNPALSLCDVFFVAKLICIILLLRVVLCGAYHPSLASKPNLFRFLFGKYCHLNKKQKFSENLWYAVWHTTSFSWNAWILCKQSISRETPGWPLLMLLQRTPIWYFLGTVAEVETHGSIGWPVLAVPPEVRIFYLTQLAFWSSNLIYIFLETQRSDFRVMLVHHIATFFLIFASYMINLCRVGLVVVFLHDVVDIFLYCAKASHYTRMHKMITDFFFVCFTVSFFVARLVLYPTLVVKPCMDYRVYRAATLGVVSYPWDLPGVGLMIIGLCVLQVLHVFWFYLILRMVLTLLKRNTVTDEGDVRSEPDMDEPSYQLDNEVVVERDDDQVSCLSALSGLDPSVEKQLLHDETPSPQKGHQGQARRRRGGDGPDGK